MLEWTSESEYFEMLDIPRPRAITLPLTVHAGQISQVED